MRVWTCRRLGTNTSTRKPVVSPGTHPHPRGDAAERTSRGPTVTLLVICHDIHMFLALRMTNRDISPNTIYQSKSGTGIRCIPIPRTLGLWSTPIRAHNCYKLWIYFLPSSIVFCFRLRLSRTLSRRSAELMELLYRAIAITTTACRSPCRCDVVTNVTVLSELISSA